MTRYVAPRKPAAGDTGPAMLHDRFMRSRNRNFALVCLLVTLGGAGPDVRVQQFADPPAGSIGLRGEQRYSLARGDLTAILSYVPTSLALTLRMDGRTAPVGLAEQASLLAPLLARFLQDHPKPPRLTFLMVDHTEVLERLATVLGSCANWDGRTGRPLSGALGQFVVDTINRHDLVKEITSVFADLGYRFAAQGASMISEGHLPEANTRLVPTDMAYLSFVADQPSEIPRRTTWPTRFHRSTC